MIKEEAEALQEPALQVSHRDLNTRARKRALEVAAELAHETRAKLAALGRGAAVALPPLRSFKGQVNIRQRYGIGGATSELALLATQARLSMAGALVRSNGMVEASPALPALPPARPATPKLTAAQLRKAPSAEKFLKQEKCDGTSRMGRPRTLQDETKAAAELAAEVKAALEVSGAQAALKQREQTALVVKQKFQVGSEAAANVLRLAKARLSMAGLRAKCLSHRQLVYLKPDAMPSQASSARSGKNVANVVTPTGTSAVRSRATTSSARALLPGAAVAAAVNHNSRMELGASALRKRIEARQRCKQEEEIWPGKVRVKQEIIARRSKRKHVVTSKREVEVKQECGAGVKRPRWRADVFVLPSSTPGRHRQGVAVRCKRSQSSSGISDIRRKRRTVLGCAQVTHRPSRLVQWLRSLQRLRLRILGTSRGCNSESRGRPKAPAASPKASKAGSAARDPRACAAAGKKPSASSSSSSMTVPSRYMLPEQVPPYSDIRLLCVSQVPGWSMHLVQLLGGSAKAASVLACTGRRLAWALLRDSHQICCELRPLAASLRGTSVWRASEQASLEKIQSARCVLAALVPLEPSPVATEAAAAARASAGRAHRLGRQQRPCRDISRSASNRNAGLAASKSAYAAPAFRITGKKRRSSVSSTVSTTSRYARRRVLSEVSADVEFARVQRIELLLGSLNQRASKMARCLQERQ
eukprot:TRINITY_DN16990_c0_g1_i1.p1 TRINITY_DN16990_c0_g1~~TRINITY_DN16990_c0_g1_i1.p1  ORF type:complete len:703 (+),score=147.11 TRINITY_DN16990_c0_g1_i1:93-2201(+)